MDKALYIAMTGAKNNMLAQTARANNLANANTTGFKADYEQARAMPVFGESFPTRAFSLSERPATNMDGGAFIETGRSLDIAIQGDGWIAVQSPTGDEAYTRSGELLMDANGVLRTGKGLAVMGEGGPIVIPPAAHVEIGVDGVITVQPLGAAPNELAQVDRIKLVNPEKATLEKSLDGLMRLRDGQPAPADANVRVESGFLEASNVNGAEELIHILSLTRQYEMQTKMMKTIDENSAAAASIMRMG
ncbi:flagellar basal-body rod protein FlgF [Oceanospirillum multiglobuliferum]|uniref:Flagellar basal-body rod protein FlgF n=1 Tax=Oceanospirillum multiglobuliferum TaxID=64969 RepID=A0A1T4RJX4_9GAMM|nr:flagellar basal body rod protein FlgF [Oceanospirillum multiglobuliferum]OPX54826.1 flagellar biosynthesis protein FlgF [Oceanospirillum multiglobuliferum]SKA16076.1 flagellar basal-body rod protein FlgF [Oceanospirillum multiglobuliferum]